MVSWVHSDYYAETKLKEHRREGRETKEKLLEQPSWMIRIAIMKPGH
jgi:hypothetical protein